jgi:caffeoyl-CoA O-methyltransferase
MNFLPPAIDDYATSHTSGESELLHDLYRETYQKVLQPRMLSGHLQGRLLSAVSKMIRPSFILEIGTYTGYSAICLAEGLAEGGHMITIDINEELEDIVSRYLERAGLTGKVKPVTGNALEIIPTLEGSPDLVFIDADKDNYCKYYELLVDRMKSGAWLLADNVLWSGKVVAKPDPRDLDTLGLLKYNDMVQQDSRVENVLLPIRDGLMLIRKK